MKDGWVTPAYEIVGNSKKVADFTSWQICSPFLVSEKARQVLTGLSGKDIEFLPFDRIKDRELFVANVLRIEDFMDGLRSQFIPGAGIPSRVVWKTNLPSNLPPVFKTAGSPSVYVSRRFAEKAVEAGLTGVSLADPTKDRFEQIIRGEAINEYSGLGLLR